MDPQSHVTDIARVIQLAVAPVFLLTAIGTVLSVLSGRLARIVDRARVLVGVVASAGDGRQAAAAAELEVLFRRRHLVNMAITSSVISALLVSVLIAAAFVGYLVELDFSIALAVLFVAAMAAFVAALVLFLREILIAVVSLRIENR